MNKLNDFSCECQYIADTCYKWMLSNFDDKALANSLADEYNRFAELPKAIRYQKNIKKEVKQ